jgi:hypothetical protein
MDLRAGYAQEVLCSLESSSSLHRGRRQELPDGACHNRGAEQIAELLRQPLMLPAMKDARYF